MNTPSHVVVNLAALRRGEWRRLGWPIAIGALVADLPIFAFYFYQRLIAGASEQSIWTELYFRAETQLFIDLFNSIPLALVALAWSWTRRAETAAALSASWLLHLVLDLPVHNDDAHRHFLPLSFFRFESPVSYWDPQHYGEIGAGLELIVLTVASIALGRQIGSVAIRIVLALLVGLQAAAYAALYIFRLAPF